MPFKLTSMLPHAILVGGVWFGSLLLARYSAQDQYDSKPFQPLEANASRHFRFPEQPGFRLRSDILPRDLSRQVRSPARPLAPRYDVTTGSSSPSGFRTRPGRKQFSGFVPPPEPPVRIPSEPPSLQRPDLTRIPMVRVPAEPVLTEQISTELHGQSRREEETIRSRRHAVRPNQLAEPDERSNVLWARIPKMRNPIARVPAERIPTESRYRYADQEPVFHDRGYSGQSDRQLDADERSSVALFRAASPSVVNIETRIRVPTRSPAHVGKSRNMRSGSGSGIIWDRDGHVVTNYHVIRDADLAQVTLSDGTTHSARLVGTAPELDIAVLQIDVPQTQLKPLTIGRSDDLEVGQNVFAIGNPFGFDRTFTTGIVSGLGRKIPGTGDQFIKGVVQTDAAINPGNSGGPLLDSQGRLIGINTAIFSPSGASAGVSFAVPVNAVAKVVPELIRKNAPPSASASSSPSLGIDPAPLTVVEELGIQGVLVLRVSKGSAADRAGLQPTRLDANGHVRLGDVIFSVDDRPVRDADDLRRQLRGYRAGDLIVVGVRRADRPERIRLRLDAS